MPNEMPIPSFPKTLRNLLREFGGWRHPFLVQGMLHQYWKDSRWPEAEEPRGARTQIVKWNKEREASQQAKNCKAFFESAGTIRSVLAVRQQSLASQSVARTGTFTVKSALLVGVGLPNPLENGMTIHPLYGLPYLPGSAIKGVAQHYVLLRWAAEAGIPCLPIEKLKEKRGKKLVRKETPLPCFEKALLAADNPDDPRGPSAKEETWQRRCEAVAEALKKAEEPTDAWNTWWKQDSHRDQGRLYIQLFGSQKHRGRVIYFDAFPTVLEMGTDVVTPHHGDYYTKEGFPPAPAEWEDPTPNQFLVVAAGSKFRITIAAMSNRDDDRNLIQAALELVNCALTDHGIGAKTGISFGQMSA